MSEQKGSNNKSRPKDDLIKQLNTYFNEMDFQSQKKCQTYYRTLITITAIISFIIGFILQQFSICVYSTIGSAVLSIILFVPAWPFWKRNRLFFKKSQYKIKDD